MEKKDLFAGFSKLNQKERFAKLLEIGALTEEDLQFLQSGSLSNLNMANHLIENAIGYFQLPLGVVPNFYMDGKHYIVPMATEETSIIAALAKTAKWINEKGQINTSTQGRYILGQMQIANVKDFAHLDAMIETHKFKLIDLVNTTVIPGVVKRGGGVQDIHLRKIVYGRDQVMGIIHVSLDSVDAMGANMINQVLEHLKPSIEQLTDEVISMCILTNLNDAKLTIARITIHEVDQELGQRIAQASLFAELDPYRAATNNKGVLNGIDALVVATGNDWRAVEAGVHAYAVKEGQYRSITHWSYADGTLYGELIAPIVVGIVGGVTSIHPTAKMALRMLNVKSANELSRLIAAVGLVQNLGALKALCTEGITMGHMKLHLTNLMLRAGASEEEFPLLKAKLLVWLHENKYINQAIVLNLLEEIRGFESKV